MAIEWSLYDDGFHISLSLNQIIARDATNAFTDVGHSPDAIELKKQYLIGVVGSKSSGPPVAAQPVAQPAAAASSTTTASSA